MPVSPPLQIFRAACDELGNALEANGFKYRKSRRDARRQGKLFEHIVTFGTSRTNTSMPSHVHLEVRAIAWSTALAQYRRKVGIELPVNEAVLFGTEIENIFHPAPPYVRYEIGDATTRRNVLDGIVQVLRTDVLRAFELVESPDTLRDALRRESIPSLSQDTIRDYFGCFGSGSAKED